MPIGEQSRRDIASDRAPITRLVTLPLFFARSPRSPSALAETIQISSGVKRRAGVHPKAAGEPRPAGDRPYWRQSGRRMSEPDAFTPVVKIRILRNVADLVRTADLQQLTHRGVREWLQVHLGLEAGTHYSKVHTAPRKPHARHMHAHSLRAAPHLPGPRTGVAQDRGRLAAVRATPAGRRRLRPNGRGGEARAPGRGGRGG